MPSAAINNFGQKVYAEDQQFQIDEKRPLYSCPECLKRMVFVDGTKYARHFRHYRRSDCTYETEPETHEHFHVKTIVENIFRSFSLRDDTLFFGKEYKIFDPEFEISKYADVYCESNKSKRKIVVEVQQSNYDMAHFLDKILFYIYRGYTVVYLFIGNQFSKTLQNKSTIYSLKEIENRIFHESSLPIWGAYFYYDSKQIPFVEIPSYRQKLKRGGTSCFYEFEGKYIFSDSHCSTRFIKDYKPQNTELEKWLFKILYEYDLKYPKSNLCECRRTTFVKSQKKIDRYKEVCIYCKKTLRTVPNEEARSIKLNL